MAKLLYDGREYLVHDRDVPAILSAVKKLASSPGWLTINAGGGEVAQLLVGPGTPVAVHVETEPDWR